MKTQTLFQVGNSQTVVAIPRYLADELDLQKGSKVRVDKLPDGSGVFIQKEQKGKTKIPRPTPNQKAEFDLWLKEVLVEDAQILEELSVR